MSKFCESQDTKLPNPTFANRKQKQTSRHPDIRRNDNVPRNVKKTADHNSPGQIVKKKELKFYYTITSSISREDNLI